MLHVFVHQGTGFNRVKNISIEKDCFTLVILIALNANYPKILVL